MTEHVIRIGWAGYRRLPVCRCGWRGRPQSLEVQAERAGREHLADPSVRSS